MTETSAPIAGGGGITPDEDVIEALKDVVDWAASETQAICGPKLRT